MADWVREYTCGSCAEYEYEGENYKGYCRWYKTYYYPDDNCQHWEKSDYVSSGTSGCFITTACCIHRGLADDCELLTVIRRFRDEWLLEQTDGKKLVKEYYRIAPAIVAAVNESENRDEEYEKIYQELIRIKDMIEKSEYEKARNRYCRMTLFLKLKYASGIKTVLPGNTAAAVI